MSEQDHPSITINMKHTHLALCSGFLHPTTFFNECLPLNEHNMRALGGPQSVFNPWIIRFLPVLEPGTAVETHSLVSPACRQSDTSCEPGIPHIHKIKKWTDSRSLSCTHIWPGITHLTLRMSATCTKLESWWHCYMAHAMPLTCVVETSFTQLVWLLPERAWPALVRSQTCDVRVVRWLQWATALVDAMSLQLLRPQQVMAQATAVRCSLRARIRPDLHMRSTDIMAAIRFLTWWSLSKAFLTDGNVANLHASHEPIPVNIHFMIFSPKHRRISGRTRHCSIKRQYVPYHIIYD
jgi:hypothetical protein